MLANRLCFVLTSFSMILCSTAFGELTAEQAVEQIHAQAEAVFLMPLKATYQEDTYTYYLPSEIVSYLPDGKVIVEEEGTRNRSIDLETGEVKEIFTKREARFDSTINMAVRHHSLATTLYICGNRFRAEQNNPQEGFSSTYIFDGVYGHLKGPDRPRPEIRLGYYRSQAGDTHMVSPLVIAFHPQKIPHVESYALEQEGDLYKLTCKRTDSVLEYWFDPQKNYIISRFCLRVGERVTEESTVSNIVQLADLYLPGDVEYTRYFRDGKVRFRYRASNITWDLVSDIEKKFIPYAP